MQWKTRLCLTIILSLSLAGCTVVNKLDRAVEGRRAGEGRVEDPAAARAGADAAFRQGIRYKEGDGVPQSDEEATVHFRQAAEVGHADAQFMLGLALQTGRGADKSPAAALVWYRKAAEQGHIEAQFLTGLMHRSGLGTAKDSATAIGWLERAAAQDHSGAQFQLGTVYAKGEGVTEDRERALAYFEAAAERGHPEAMHLAGDAYSNGRGTVTDHAWAARWYGKAARLGVARSQYMLGVGFGAGLGLPKRPADAYFWLVLASKRGLEEATKLHQAMARRLPAKRRREIERRAAAWTIEKEAVDPDRPTAYFVQLALDAIGYSPGPIDGVLGPKTKRALARYLKDRRLGAEAPLSKALLERLREERRVVVGQRGAGTS
ncbi:MAG: SEL1-like repeat protein [Alphaproteobacteria bacterium]|jgi:TPR repeat protein|nr:SEL1-like repeat protein [Alphaproteobacteria bacterium]